MSSSEFTQPKPSAWALDELEMPDVFAPLHDMPETQAYAAPAAHDAPATRPPSAEEIRFRDAVENEVAERLAQARARIESDAYARGVAAGIEQANSSNHDKVGRLLEALVEATQSVQAHEQRWLGNVEENLAASAVTIARHLIQRELTAEPSVITDLVARSLAQFPLERQITVRLHPDDLAVLQDAIARNELAAVSAREVRWHADANVVRGGCLVDGRERVLDGRIDTALERAYRTLGQVFA